MKSDGHCITLTPDDIYTVLSEEALHVSVCVQEEHFRDFSLYFFIKGFWRDYHVWKVGHWTVRAHARARIHNAHFFTECVVSDISLSLWCYTHTGLHVLWIFCEAICSSSACLVGFVVVVYSVDAGEDSLRENNELTLLHQLWRQKAAKYPKLLLKTKC